MQGMDVDDMNGQMATYTLVGHWMILVFFALVWPCSSSQYVYLSLGSLTLQETSMKTSGKERDGLNSQMGTYRGAST